MWSAEQIARSLGCNETDFENFLCQIERQTEPPYPEPEPDGTFSDEARDRIESLWESSGAKEWCDQGNSLEADLATMPYRDYLLTKHWARVREAALRRDGCCVVCGRTQHETVLNVHHRSYANRGDFERELQDVVTLCRREHRIFHEFFSQRKKTTTPGV